MRLSLYVPDALWLRARETHPVSGNSRLVQSALECLVADSRPSFLEGPPPAIAERLRRLQARLTGEARAAYQAGYDAGLDLAEVVDWWVLDQLAGAHWRLDPLLPSLSAGGVLDDLRRLLAERGQPASRDFVAELERGRDGDVRRAATFASGLVAALRDCFEAGAAVTVVSERGDGAPEPEPGEGPTA
jgi:hypothetical protein